MNRLLRARLARLLTALAVLEGSACAQAGPPSQAARTCGGTGGLQCPAGLVCMMEGAPHPDQTGLCRPATSRTLCPQIYIPVCGADGRTYPNRCIAENRGVGVAGDGRCEASSSAPAGGTAVQSPSGPG